MERGITTGYAEIAATLQELEEGIDWNSDIGSS
jgi:hypothetical protein